MRDMLSQDRTQSSLGVRLGWRFGSFLKLGPPKIRHFSTGESESAILRSPSGWVVRHKKIPWGTWFSHLNQGMFVYLFKAVWAPELRSFPACWGHDHGNDMALSTARWHILGITKITSSFASAMVKILCLCLVLLSWTLQPVFWKAGLRMRTWQCLPLQITPDTQLLSRRCLYFEVSLYYRGVHC